MKRVKSIFVFSLITQLLISGGIYGAEKIVKIDRTIAQKEALIHRQDTIKKGKEKPELKNYVKNNKPNRVVVTLKKDSATTRAFNWYTTERFESFVEISTSKDFKNKKVYYASPREVESHYLERDKKGYFLYQLKDKKTGDLISYFTDEGKEAGKWDYKMEIKDKENEEVVIDIIKIKEIVYKAEINNLKPETTYYYRVGSIQGGMSEIGEFKTASNKNKKFSFLHYTDTQNAYWNENLIDEASYGADTLKRALEVDPSAAFVLHTGDIVEIAEVEDEWVDLFEKSRESLLKTTLVPVAGNHDEYGLNRDERFTEKFNEHFNIPAEGPIDGGSYYSIDYNGVHFINLNTNDNKNPENEALGKDQLDWLRADVRNARNNGAKWIILNFHKPLFSKSYHSLQDEDVQNIRDKFMKLIDELDIDLALQGHDHVLSRTKPLTYVSKNESIFNAKVSEKGTTFILPNTGGTKAYDAIYDKGLEHVKKVRPKLSWLTEKSLKEYNNFFAFGEQPQKSDLFKKSHSNFRDSKSQNFARYIVDGNKLSVEIYQIEGELTNRKIKLVDKVSIQK